MQIRFALLVACLSMACSVASPASPTGSRPTAGVPARVELSAVPGIGVRGGTAAITARALDAYGSPVAGAAIAFGASAGAFTATDPATDGAGVAHASLTAEPGAVQIVAEAGPVRAEVAAVVQPVVSAVPPPVSVPPPAVVFPEPSLNVEMHVQPAAVLAGRQVLFWVIPSHYIVRADWTTGDGASGSTSGPTVTQVPYIYTRPGRYTATVTVTDSAGKTATDTMLVEALVDPHPPTP